MLACDRFLNYSSVDTRLVSHFPPNGRRLFMHSISFGLLHTHISNNNRRTTWTTEHWFIAIHSIHYYRCIVRLSTIIRTDNDWQFAFPSILWLRPSTMKFSVQILKDVDATGSCFGVGTFTTYCHLIMNVQHIFIRLLLSNGTFSTDNTHTWWMVMITR